MYHSLSALMKQHFKQSLFEAQQYLLTHSTDFKMPYIKPTKKITLKLWNNINWKLLTDSALWERHLKRLRSNSWSFSAFAMSEVSLLTSAFIAGDRSWHRNWSKHYNTSQNSLLSWMKWIDTSVQCGQKPRTEIFKDYFQLLVK